MKTIRVVDEIDDRRMYAMAKMMEVPEGTDKVDVRKRINKMLSTARRNAKPTVCVLCGKTVTSFCNSHSVPQMALKPIADNGIIQLFTSLIRKSKTILVVKRMRQRGRLHAL